jgi:AraC family transcriptional regulator
MYAHKAGAAIAGRPFTRYLEWGPGMVTIEPGLPIAVPVAGEGDIHAETLPGGLVAMTTHRGLYDKLIDAHAALQVWIESSELTSAGAPWESYVTDPVDFPDPADWKTDVFWPVKP